MRSLVSTFIFLWFRDDRKTPSTEPFSGVIEDNSLSGIIIFCLIFTVFSRFFFEMNPDLFSL